MPRKYTSRQEALLLMYKFCAYRERSHREVRTKLISLGVYGDDLEDVMASLIAEGYLNEERFARAFARGKFRMKKWGRRKILSGLKQQDISEYAVRKAMAEIDEEEYTATARELILKKINLSTKDNVFEQNQQVARQLIQKGYEPELVWQLIKELNSP